MPLLGARATASRGYFGGGTKPGDPVITSSTQGVSSLSIAFTPPVFNGGLLISKYEYAVSINNSTWTTFATAVSGTNPPTSPVTISGLTNGQAYYVKLRAVNGLGFGPDSNTWSTTTTPRTTPDAPTLSSVTRGYRQLTANFSAPAFNGGSAITDYEYSTNGGSTWASMGQSGTTAYVITGLADFTSYDVRVRAVNVAGGGAHSATVSAYTAGVTNAPTSLAASSNGVFQSVLTWAAPDSNASAITDYVVQYSPNNSTWTTFSDGVSATTGATVTSLSAATTYYYRVASINAVGQSGWSNVPSAATAGVPSQVDTPTSSSGDKSFTISWSAPATGGSAITSYSVQYSTNGGSSWSTAETFTSANTEFTNRSKTWTATNGTSYVGRVLATNAVGSGAYSAASTARTPGYGAPGVSISSSGVASYATEGQRTVSMTIDPPDALNYDRTEVWVARNGQDYTYAGDAGLKARWYAGSGTGNLSVSFTTSYYNDGTYAFEYAISPSDVIKYRVITYNSSGYSTETNGTYTVLAYTDYTYQPASYYVETAYTSSTGVEVCNKAGGTAWSRSTNVSPYDANTRIDSVDVDFSNPAAVYDAYSSTRWFTLTWSGLTGGAGGNGSWTNKNFNTASGVNPDLVNYNVSSGYDRTAMYNFVLTASTSASFTGNFATNTLVRIRYTRRVWTTPAAYTRQY